ncbi:hypothetical protein [Paenibacillus lentus]|uniref:Uncharacterized protein n=1 Tax=Paenibacillus lentus TaxID=1338368 RepID=A0A3S8RX69_9BACL|nr:hypothetical protein [Paenibacillus lentus]AZK47383.1 hypothetical protein EIM92_15490 [Paenibacillus lentus]
MSKIIFWDLGYGGSAEVAAAFSVQAGLHDKYHLLLMNYGYSGTGVEEGFLTRNRELDRDLRLPVQDYGMEALMRLAESGRLYQANMMDYTYPLLQGRLDLADGMQTNSDPRDPAYFQHLEAILNMAERYYDIIVTQVSGLESILMDSLREDDILIAVLRQNRVELDTFFKLVDVSDAGRGNKPMALVIPHYDAASKWSLQNIKRRYNCEAPMIGIPYHTEFNDAWNGQDIIGFFRRYRLLKGRGYEREQFLFSCKELARLALTGTVRSKTSAIDDKMKGA